VNAAAVAAWLADAVDPSFAGATLAKLASGHSAGAWRVDGGCRPLVVKAPELPSVVHRRDATREARILAALHAGGAPVPEVVAIDADGTALGRPCFAMALVRGRGLDDDGPAGYHDDPALQALDVDGQRAVWEGWYDALATMHSVPASSVPDADLGPGGSLDVLAYWREALLDVAPAAAVPRQLRALDWLGSNLPGDADDAPAPCMGDARFANCLVDGTEVTALVDFEVAYLGHPAADVGYSAFLDGMQRRSAPRPLAGAGSDDEAWARWSAATGRPATDRAFWTAFGATIIVITATRALVQWEVAPDDPEPANHLVTMWEALVTAAAR
jgi:aminoglycoside phosphotransferase (APT) family kinase protein